MTCQIMYTNNKHVFFNPYLLFYSDISWSTYKHFHVIAQIVSKLIIIIELCFQDPALQIVCQNYQSTNQILIWHWE